MVILFGRCAEGFRRGEQMEAIVVRISDAADMLATSPNRIKELIDQGELYAYRDGKNWSIPKSLIHKYAEDRAINETAERKKQCQE